MEDEMKDAKSASERVTREQEQLVIFLESEKDKFRSLSEEKDAAIQDKNLAVEQKELAMKEKE